MPRNVTRIPETQRIPVKGQQRRVVAYCRVSTKHEEQQQSLEAQIDYYTNYYSIRLATRVYNQW